MITYNERYYFSIPWVVAYSVVSHIVSIVVQQWLWGR